MPECQERLRAAVIVPWRGAFTGQANRIALPVIKWESILETEFKLPIGIVVVGVEEFLPRAELKAIEAYPVGIIEKTEGADSGNAVAFAANQEVVQILVVPIHHYLGYLPETSVNVR